MGNCCQPGPPLRPYRENARHEAGQAQPARRQREITAGGFDRHDRRERPELFAVLDVAVQPVTHFGLVRSRQNAAVAQSPRSEFGGAIHPADDTARGQIVGDPLDQRVLVQFFDKLAVFVCHFCQPGPVNRRPPERVIRDFAVRVAEVDTVRIERGAERAAGIAGSGRDEDALEAGLGKDPCVGDAIQCHTAANTKIRHARLALKTAGHLNQSVLENSLHAAGAIREPLAPRGLQVNRLRRVTRRSEQVHETRGKGSFGRGLILEVIQVQRERAVRRAVNQLANVIHHRRAAVGGEPHNLVLVFVHREAQVRRERRVQHSQRMRKPDLAQKCNRRASVRTPLAVADRECGPFAHTVSRQDGGAARWRSQEGSGRVRLMMFGEQDLTRRHAQVR